MKLDETRYDLGYSPMQSFNQLELTDGTQQWIILQISHGHLYLLAFDNKKIT